MQLSAIIFNKQKYPNSNIPLFAQGILTILIIITIFSLNVEEAQSDQTPQAPFTIIVLPDTQHYSQNYPKIFVEQTEWIRDNLEEMNIAAVIHLGDITNTNDKKEWEAAARALNILEDKIPLFLAAGNHDTGPSGNRKTIETELLDDFFPPSKYEMKPWFGGAFERHSIKNAYYVLKVGYLEFIVVCLEFGPRDEVLDWAGSVLAKYEHKKAIIVTHCYLNYDNLRVGEGDAYNPHRYPNKGNAGEEIWNKLVRKHHNISFVLSGHVGGDGTGRQTSRGDNGNPVHELLSNYQLRLRGGNGWLRIMEFVPEQNRVYVSTYSPCLDRYDKRKKNKFELEFQLK